VQAQQNTFSTICSESKFFRTSCGISTEVDERAKEIHKELQVGGQQFVVYLPNCPSYLSTNTPRKSDIVEAQYQAAFVVDPAKSIVTVESENKSGTSVGREMKVSKHVHDYQFELREVG